MFRIRCRMSLLSFPNGGALVCALLGALWTSACDALPSSAQPSEPASPAVGLSETAALLKGGMAEAEWAVTELEGLDGGAMGDTGAAECVEAVRALARECLMETRSIAKGCIAEIARLFAANLPEDARQVAEGCVEQINTHTEDCLQALREQCRMCIEALLSQDAPLEAVEAFERKCRRLAMLIIQARRGAVSAIMNAADQGTARHCIKVIQQRATECTTLNKQTAEQCIALILELLAQGRVEEAEAAARTCIEQIRARTVECVEAIQAQCQKCLQRLHRDCGDFALVTRVREACGAGIRTVLRTTHEAVVRIRASLENTPPAKPAP